MSIKIETVLSGQVKWDVSENSETIAISGNALDPDYRKHVHFVSNHTDLYTIGVTGMQNGDTHLFIFTDGTPCAIYHVKATVGNLYLGYGLTPDSSFENYTAIQFVYSSDLGKWVKV